MSGRPEWIDGASLSVQTLSTVTATRIEPVLPGLLYRGKVTVIAGLPGDGKSLLSQDIAARVSCGDRWPCGNGRFQAERVLMMVAEDDAADTLRPRFDVAGADPAMIDLVRGVTRLDDDGRSVLDPAALLTDLDLIEQRIELTECRLLVIDPFTSFASGADTNKTGDMRLLLDRLAQMTARTKVATLIDTHLNKKSDARKAMQMVAGSHVLIAAVRVAMVTTRDPNDRHRRLLLPLKLNIAADEGGFAFRIMVEHHPVCGDTPRAQWEPDRVTDVSADDALIDATPRAQAAVERANEVQDWLRDLLRDEPVLASTMWRQAKEKGYGEHRVRSALKAIGARAETLGFQAKWHYRMPQSPQ